MGCDKGDFDVISRWPSPLWSLGRLSSLFFFCISAVPKLHSLIHSHGTKMTKGTGAGQLERENKRKVEEYLGRSQIELRKSNTIWTFQATNIYRDLVNPAKNIIDGDLIKRYTYLECVKYFLYFFFAEKIVPFFQENRR